MLDFDCRVQIDFLRWIDRGALDIAGPAREELVGMLIDTGCKHTAEELNEYLKNLKLNKAVNTHYHEDHIRSI